jgi:hypothetical protein
MHLETEEVPHYETHKGNRKWIIKGGMGVLGVCIVAAIAISYLISYR